MYTTGIYIGRRNSGDARVTRDYEKLSQASEFDWDIGNSEKNWIRHRVSRAECEEFFFNLPLVIGEDESHSQTEDRHFALGQTDRNRRLFVVFTIRGEKIRIISARDMNRAERRIYDEKKDSEIQE